MVNLAGQRLLIGLILHLLLGERVQRYFRDFDGTELVVEFAHSLENLCVASLTKE